MRLPVMASVTITDQAGRTLVGPDDRGVLEFDLPFRSAGVGINCALGPEQMRPYVEELSRIAPVYVSCHPNAGLAERVWRVRPVAAQHGGDVAGVRRQRLAEHCGRLLRHDAALHRGAGPHGARACRRGACPRSNRSRGSAARKPLTLRPDANFVMIGERTNVTGSRKFARLIREEKFDEAVEIARQQVEAGASVIDINMDDALLDGEAMMTRFLNLIAAEPDISRVPVMIDSSKWSVLEAGLKCTQGKSIVNSISLKDGEEEFLRRARLDPALRCGGGGDGLRRAGTGDRGRRQGADLPPRLRAADRAASASRRKTSSSIRTS